MATSGPTVIERLRQPEYTGENRCLPCTVVNAAIAVVLAVAVGVVEPALGVAVAVVAAAAIYLRGYLVPGTPTLTKRYLPDRVLRWFDKAPERERVGPPDRTDVEGYLLDVDAVEPAGEDLAVTEAFAAEWHAAIEAVREDPAATAGDLLDLEDPAVEERDFGAVVTEDGYPAAEWPSRAALLADLGAVRVLAERDDDWEAQDRTAQGRILSGLRVFLETCPDCGGTPELGEETVESCCREAQVLTYTCGDCDARLLEIED